MSAEDRRGSFAGGSSDPLLTPRGAGNGGEPFAPPSGGGDGKASGNPHSDVAPHPLQPPTYAQMLQLEGYSYPAAAGKDAAIFRFKRPDSKALHSQAKKDSASFVLVSTLMGSIFLLAGNTGALPKDTATFIGGIALVPAYLSRLTHAVSWFPANDMKERQMDAPSAHKDPIPAGGAAGEAASVDAVVSQKDVSLLKWRNRYHRAGIIAEFLAMGPFFYSGMAFRNNEDKKIVYLLAACSMDGIAGVFNFMEMRQQLIRTTGKAAALPSGKQLGLIVLGMTAMGLSFLISDNSENPSAKMNFLKYGMFTLGCESLKLILADGLENAYLTGVRKKATEDHKVNLEAQKRDHQFSLGSSRPFYLPLLCCLSKQKFPDVITAWIIKLLGKGMVYGTGYAIADPEMSKTAAFLFGGVASTLAASIHGQWKASTVRKVDLAAFPDDHQNDYSAYGLQYN